MTHHSRATVAAATLAARTLATALIITAAALTAVPAGAARQALKTVVRAAMKAHNDAAQANDSAKVDRLVPELHLADWRTLDFDTIALQPSYLFVPLIFESQRLSTDTIAQPESLGQYGLDADRSWLTRLIAERNAMQSTRYRAIVSNPSLVPYNAKGLPEPPQELGHATADPKKSALTIERKDYKDKLTVDAKTDEVKKHHWLHTFVGTMHFSQAYMSDNWYQGGNNNVNALGEIQWTVALNQNLHPNYIFSNSVRYKIGVNSTPNDSLRDFGISEDLLQINTQFGVKAIRKWYYSANMLFETQVFNNYATNSQRRTSSFLSPAKLNIGVGITYSTRSKDGTKTFDLSISPVSYNMKICASSANPAPQDFGIKAGHKTLHDIGSRINARFYCKFNRNITWTSQLYAFSNYDYVQGDWENTFDFNVTTHLSTKFYTHLRYDKSARRDDSWKYWQLKEILSFGLTYRFATH